MSRMQKILLACVVTFVLLCVGGGLYGYFRIWPRVPAAISAETENQIADSVQSAVSQRIAAAGRNPNQIVIYAQDFDFNDYVDGTDESGFDYANGDVTIYNSVVTIDANGIDVYLADMHLHAGMEVIDGRIELVDPRTDRGLTGFLAKPDAIVDGIERGMNEALAMAEKPVHRVTMNSGYLTIRFDEMPGNPLCAAGGLGCEPDETASASPVLSAATPE